MTIRIIRFDTKNTKDIFLDSKLSDPLASFYEYLIVETENEENFLDGKTVDVSKVVINEDFYNTEVLGKIVKKYAKRKLSFATETKVQVAISMYNLDIGPKTSKDVPVGTIILESGWLKPIEE